jgi:acid stress-induced BolA-like protein IbaG/YrbA
MNEDEIREMIEHGLPGSRVSVTGDGRHFEAVVVHEAFAGKSMLEQHRMVYATLGESFRTDALHALSLKTYSSAEWPAPTRAKPE